MVVKYKTAPNESSGTSGTDQMLWHSKPEMPKPLGASGLCQLAGKAPSALQEAAAVLPHPLPSSFILCRSHQDALSSRMSSLSVPPYCKQHPTAMIRVTAENSDSCLDPIPTLVASLFLCHCSKLPHCLPPTLLVVWGECKLDNERSLSGFIYFGVRFSGLTPGQSCSLFRPLFAKLQGLGWGWW